MSITPFMKQILEQIYQFQSYDKVDRDRLIDLHEIIQIKKGDYLLKRGATAQHYWISVEGLLRSYVIDSHGNEVTTSFFQPYDVVIEEASLFLRIPTRESLQAITDCTLFQLNYQDFQQEFSTVPALAEWGRSWMTMALAQQKNRLLNLLTLSAQDRYLNLLDAQPEILKHAPLKYIASYLGVTDTSLSRIRKEVMH